LRSILIALYDSVIDKEDVMTTVTISPKYQVVIPKSIRDSLGLKPGQKIQAIEYNGRVELVPVRPVREMRGFLSGIDTTVPREDDRV
jgi:AbrB family looped-hinge helix DNA binding protein